MTRIVVGTNISHPIETVFDDATTPANWPEWHPASHAVSGAVDHSLLVGEEVQEDFVAGALALKERLECDWSPFWKNED